ncbi:probable cytochrome P450 9f2 [Lutzomyia longipalpis]|uniref:probable cytochrome P450 9f2 n=1 Tax=Lutzomyia longipalpis TaxID=7200 RepID=UPI002483CE9D|nr:probable cytochrome P450 9f2 [Lutzomyia longipalpis]
MILPFLLFTAIAVAIYYIYTYGTKNENYFLERGIPFRKPMFIFGNSFKLVIRKLSAFEYVRDMSKYFPGEKLVGVFDFRDPVVFMLDPEIVKHLCVKEFDSFTDHRKIISEDSDHLFANSLFALQGQKWKDMRATLSPAFTGSKMRQMCDLIVEICEQMVAFLKEEVEEKGPQIYEAKEVYSRFATDVIGTCAFGIKVDSLKDKENDFYKTAQKMFNFSNILVLIKFVLFRLVPMVMKFFNIQLFDEKCRSFLKNSVLDTMKVREEKKIIRPDMIHLLMEAQKGNLTHTTIENDTAGFATVEESHIGRSKAKRTWSEDEIVAQCFLFFLAGYDTISNMLSFTTYEIMVNPDIQERLFEEISETNSNLDGKSLKYDTLQNLKYLDMVISESLRKWSAPAVDRVCNRTFTLKYDNKEYTFHKGDVFWIPIVGFHHNPEYFPNPEKFDPERFNDENKSSINPAAYIPFGVGPRNCIGSRFALMVLKSILYYLILNFHIDVTEKTQIPVKLAKSLFGLQSERGIHVSFRPRR